MKRFRPIAGVLGVVFGLCYGCSALAGAISVSPTRIALSARHPIATMEVRNEGADTVTIQLERMAWTQPDGRDVYASSTALIATPSVFELAPHGVQVLRIALRDGSPIGERAYRLYATEVPIGQRMSGPGLQMSLRIGIPVFAESAGEGSQLDGAIITAPDGQREVRVRNGGGHFSRAIRLEMQDSAGTVLWQTRSPAYVLAGGEYRWPVDSDAVSPAAHEPLRLSVITETGVENIDVQRLP